MLVPNLSNMIKIVGVFLDADIKFVKEVLNQVQIDIIQLHGNEDMKYILKLKEFFNGRFGKVFLYAITSRKFINKIPND